VQQPSVAELHLPSAGGCPLTPVSLLLLRLLEHLSLVVELRPLRASEQGQVAVLELVEALPVGASSVPEASFAAAFRPVVA